MSDWRMWARIVVGVIIAAIVFTVFLNILGDYQTAKRQQKLSESSTTDTGPASTVTETGRPPLTTNKSGSSGATTGSTTKGTGKVVLVVVSGVNMRNLPSTTGDIIRALKRNERLTYLSTKNGYYEVRDQSGTKGWVSAKRDYTRLVSAQ